MKILKRNGSEAEFDSNKIFTAISKANESPENKQKISKSDIQAITTIVGRECGCLNHTVTVEEVQDMVENALIDQGFGHLMKVYADYRTERALRRNENTTDAQMISLLAGKNEEMNTENANKSTMVNSTLRDYIAGIPAKDLARRKMFSPRVMKAHDLGIIHNHDMDYIVMPEYNCCVFNLEDMLQNGTVINKTLIEKPHSFATACNVATQIIAQVASNQYGGQTVTLSHLAPFVDISRQKIIEEFKQEGEDIGEHYTDDKVKKIAERRLQKEIERGVQTIQYQINTLLTSNGQTPFVTLFMYLDEVPAGRTRDDLAMIIREVLRQRIQGTKNETGVWITPAFPKLIYVLDEDNIEEGTPYWDITVLAAECTAKRMVPDYISAKIMKETKGDVYPCMGCRSFLTTDNENNAEGLCNAGNKANAGNYHEGEHKYYGRFNQGVVTVNPIYAACESDGDMTKFWQLLDEYCEIAHEALQTKHNRLMGVTTDSAPILWQYGAIARLPKGAKIDPLLFGNYSTISLGICGIAETTWRMLGKSNTTTEGSEFATKVMQFFNDKCKKWRAEENISYSVYGTPMESTTYRFATCLQKCFGIIPHVTDKSYITNSYHIHVTEPVDAFTKLSFESKFQALTPGGAISYVEVPNMTNNIPAVLAVMKHIYNNIMYAELNTKSDYCQVCGYDGEIKIVEDDGKLIWKCPNCGNRDQTKMNVARRTCGYIGTNFFNQGRTAEIRDRVMHL